MKFTTNYDQFLLMHENRSINKRHVKELAESIKTQNLLEANPIIVNPNFEIIDGQHRLEACRLLKIPVPYVLVNDGSIGTVVRLNTKQRNWSMFDYVTSYVNQGKDQYRILIDFATHYHLPISTAAIILQGRNSGGGNSTTKTVRNGTFRVTNLKLATKVMEVIKAIAPYVEKNVLSDKLFYTVFLRLLKEERVKEARLVEKFSMVKQKLPRMATENLYLREIETIYNFYAKQEVRLF